MNPRYPQHPCRARYLVRYLGGNLGRYLAIVAAAATLALAGATAAAAQYQWRDGQGRMVYSDLPPPASIAANRIIRAPEAPRAAESPQAAPSPAASSPSATGGAPMAAARAGTPGAADPSQTIADREMAYRKRQADQAAKEKEALEAAQRRTELAKACSDAQGDIRSLESGIRISRINASGEREFLSDAERLQRLKDARKSVGERC